MTEKSLKLDINNLPLKLEIYSNGIIKNIYLIKSNKDKTSVFLNKAEFIK